MMVGKKITLACEVCHSKNYRVKKSNQQRLTLMKYCSRCQMHTSHREEK